ncbi:MAG: hypothetical protein IJI68_02665 [Eggerthellaceae bacterium]|nr:hypothetical protein [Eggerthellaceae bacterium]
MIESKLRNALERSEKGITDKGVSCRMSNARAAERMLRRDLDAVVCTDEKMFAALSELRADKRERKTGRLQNAVRWYYKARNGREFPRFQDYEFMRTHCPELLAARGA